MKLGVLCSRGLGDILITLPIAKFYHDQDYEIIWPICQEFHSSVKDSAPWVKWFPIETDTQGDFFMKKPIEIFEAEGVKIADVLNCYHYLNTMPELTDPELFNILKFDQYRYASTGVPFLEKWKLADCIVRDHKREADLAVKLGLNTDQPYAVVHLKGSTFNVDTGLLGSLPFLAGVKVINIDEHLTDSIFDWLGVLEGAASVICVDSAVANMVDQMKIDSPDLYWIRRSAWDATPVLGLHWVVIPTNLPIVEPQRVDPAKEALAKQNRGG